MATMRCDKHPPTGGKYTASASPIGYPHTAAICGKVGCESPARLWLSKQERADHERGVRIFNIRTYSATVKIRVSDAITLS